MIQKSVKISTLHINELMVDMEVKTQSYLITPPPSDGCSSRGSIVSDTRSEASVCPYVSSPQSINENEFCDIDEEMLSSEKLAQSPESYSFRNSWTHCS